MPGLLRQCVPHQHTRMSGLTLEVAAAAAGSAAAMHGFREELNVSRDLGGGGCFRYSWARRGLAWVVEGAWELISHWHESNVYDSHCGRNVKR